MKLLLASSGFTNPEIVKACTQLVGKKRSEISFAIIDEAVKAETGDKSWFEEGMREIRENFGGKIELLDFERQSLAEIRERIAAADVIFCFGGNTEYLAKVFREKGFAEILPEILAEKVWVGSSAGSCVLCHKESAEAQRQIFQEEPLGEDYLNLVPVVILPHYHGWFEFGEPEIKAEAEKSAYPVYALSDQAALKVVSKAKDGKTNLKIETVGEDFYFSGGREINGAVTSALDAAETAIQQVGEMLGKF